MGSAHPLDRRRLALVRAFGDADSVADTNLLALYIQSYCTVGTGIALTTKLLRADLANNAVVVHDGELLTTDANNHAHLVC